MTILRIILNVNWVPVNMGFFNPNLLLPTWYLTYTIYPH